jgi:hypothetical protein
VHVERLERPAPDLAPRLRIVGLDQGVRDRPEHVRNLPGIAGHELARRDALFEGCMGHVQVALPEARDLIDHRAGQVADHALVVDRPEDLEIIRMLEPMGEVEARDRTHAIERRPAVATRGDHQVEEDLVIVGQDGDVEVGLALEVAVERALRDAGLFGHLVEIGAHEPVPEEHVPGGLEDAASALGLLLVARHAVSFDFSRDFARAPAPARSDPPLADGPGSLDPA